MKSKKIKDFFKGLSKQPKSESLERFKESFNLTEEGIIKNNLDDIINYIDNYYQKDVDEFKSFLKELKDTYKQWESKHKERQNERQTKPDVFGKVKQYYPDEIDFNIRRERQLFMDSILNYNNENIILTKIRNFEIKGEIDSNIKVILKGFLINELQTLFNDLLRTKSFSEEGKWEIKETPNARVSELYNGLSKEGIIKRPSSKIIDMITNTKKTTRNI